MWGLREQFRETEKNPRCVLYSCIPNLKGPTQTCRLLFRELVKVTPTLKKITESAMLNCSTFLSDCSELMLDKMVALLHLSIWKKRWSKVPFEQRCFNYSGVSVTLSCVQYIRSSWSLTVWEMMKMRCDTKRLERCFSLARQIVGITVAVLLILLFFSLSDWQWTPGTSSGFIWPFNHILGDIYWQFASLLGRQNCRSKQ